MRGRWRATRPPRIGRWSRSARSRGSDPASFLARLREAADARAARFGSCAHLLEPDLKEGTGGLRDVASLGWIAAAVGADLEVVGLLRSRERIAIDDAEEFLVRARSAVQLLTGRRTDRLVAELQPDVAREMGFTDEPGLVAADALMRALFEHARDVELVAGIVPQRIGAAGTAADRDDTGRKPGVDPRRAGRPGRCRGAAVRRPAGRG